MWFQRLLVALILLPIGLGAMFAGKVYFAVLMVVIVTLAAKEYLDILRDGGLDPADFALYGLVISAGFGVVFFREIDPLLYVATFIMAGTIYHLFKYEAGREQALVDMVTTYAGILYLGVLGSHFLRIRVLDDGEWWMMMVFTSVWLADTGAYMIGSRFGKRPLVPRLSPKKTWEGYLGGLVSAIALSPVFMLIYRQFGLPVDSEITIVRTMVIGGALGLFTVAGDLTISSLKRVFHLKDTGNILLGHGGMLDRIDSWLWGATIGYYLIAIIFLN